MDRAWFWMLRNPAFALAAVALAAGASGVVTLGLSLMTTLFFVVVADLAHHIGHRALDRRARKLAAMETLAEARELRQRRIEQDQRRAA